MTLDDDRKKKKPRTNMDLIAVEDRLESLKGVFRDIRKDMGEAGMPSVELAIGTFVHYLDLMDSLAAKYRGEFNSQKIDQHARQFREKKRADIQTRMSKDTRK